MRDPAKECMISISIRRSQALWLFCLICFTFVTNTNATEFIFVSLTAPLYIADLLHGHPPRHQATTPSIPIQQVVPREVPRRSNGLSADSIDNNTSQKLRTSRQIRYYRLSRFDIIEVSEADETLLNMGIGTRPHANNDAIFAEKASAFLSRNSGSSSHTHISFPPRRETASTALPNTYVALELPPMTTSALGARIDGL